MHLDDNQALSLRVVDPIAYEGVWAIIDDGCNSCCHREVLRQNAAAKTCLVAEKGNYFEWCGNEHNKRKVENSYGHLTAGIGLGHTRMRAFTRHPGEDASFVGVSGMSSQTGNDETCARTFNHT